MFKKETVDEKNKAERLMAKLREEQLPRLRAEFNTREAAKDVSICQLLRVVYTNV